MGSGMIGRKCWACGLNFNTYWNSVTMEFGGGDCPECNVSDCISLSRPVAVWDREEITSFEEEDLIRHDDIEVELSFLRAEHGGRRSAVCSGYCPQFYYQNDDHGAMHVYPDGRSVEPGQTVNALLTFINPAGQSGRIAEGMPFLIREGNKTVAYGRVKRILNLEESVRRQAEGAAGSASIISRSS